MESLPGQGTTFAVDLPIGVIEPAKDTVADVYPAREVAAASASAPIPVRPGNPGETRS